VAYLSGDTLYVTTAEGNTIKVKTSPATTVTKSVTTTVKSIHPGETVTVRGPAAVGGAVTAESVTVGAGGGIASLFGGGAPASPSSAGGAGAVGGTSLFGAG
jgi:hypothetical protein